MRSGPITNQRARMKLSDVQILRIYKLAHEGYEYDCIKERFGVAKATIVAIKKGRLFPSVTQHKRKD